MREFTSLHAPSASPRMTVLAGACRARNARSYERQLPQEVQRQFRSPGDDPLPAQPDDRRIQPAHAAPASPTRSRATTWPSPPPHADVPALRPCIVSGRACLYRLSRIRRLRFSSTLEKRAGGLSKAQASDTRSGLAPDRPSPEHGALRPMPLYHKIQHTRA
jgi:hypothetical protein